VHDPVVIGVVLGLLVGKPVGVFGGTWLVTRFTRAELNETLSYRDLVGVAVLAGIGFTVSLLVSDLSFSGADLDAAKTAVPRRLAALRAPRRPVARPPGPLPPHAVASSPSGLLARGGPGRSGSSPRSRRAW
jgi:hypothetical protein